MAESCAARARRRGEVVVAEGEEDPPAVVAEAVGSGVEDVGAFRVAVVGQAQSGSRFHHLPRGGRRWRRRR